MNYPQCNHLVRNKKCEFLFVRTFFIISIQFLVIAISPRNHQADGEGWKVSAKCEGSGDSLLKCLQENAYNESEVITNMFATNKSMIRVKSTYLNRFEGIAQFIEGDTGMITNRLMTTLRVHLNKNLSFQIAIMDTKLQFTSTSALPFIRLTLLRLSEEALVIYLKVHNELTQHLRIKNKESISNNSGN